MYVGQVQLIQEVSAQIQANFLWNPASHKAIICKYMKTFRTTAFILDT